MKRSIGILILMLVLTSCSGILEVQVSGDIQTGILFSIPEDEHERISHDVSFMVYEYEGINSPRGSLNPIMWKIEADHAPFRDLFNKRNKLTRWYYGQSLVGFNEIVTARALTAGSCYEFDIRSGIYSGGGAFYLDESGYVIKVQSCSKVNDN